MERKLGGGGQVDDLAKAWEFVKALLPAVLIAVIGNLVKYLREHRSEPFSWGEFLSGMAVAAFAGIVVQCICNGLGVGAWISAAAVAMGGYGGGRTIDLLMDVISKRASK
jgi:hypothetical protein